MKPAVILTLALALTVASRAWQPGGLYAPPSPAALERAARLVQQLPKRIGEWRYVADERQLYDLVQEELGLHGYISRKYQHEVTGQTVSLLCMAGEAGPLLCHPPELCYSMAVGRALEQELIEIPGAEGPHTIRVLHYEGRSGDTRSKADFAVGYAMTAATVWDAPRYPRFAYANAPALFKVQVLAAGGGTQAELARDVQSFWTAFVPEFDALQAGLAP